ncbi:MAG: extracellular solute-binding protein [Treponema sp.]|nr:extracellular solute-binding protein [Treponema sp.]
MKKMTTVIVVFLMATSVLFTGCRENRRQQGDGRAEVRIMTWTPIPRTMERMIAAFELENPDIRITFNNMNYNPQYLTALAAGAAANTLPDIIALQPGALTQQYRDYLVDLTPYIVASFGNNLEDRIYRINVDQMRLGNPAGDNSIYVIPALSQIINIWYNRTLFEQLGIRLPTTWDELKEASRILSANNFAPLFFGGADGWQKTNIFLMLSEQIAPGEIYSAQEGASQWTTPGMVRTMEAWVDFYGNVAQTGSLSNVAYPDGVGQFVAGRVGMMALGSWWPQEFTNPAAPPNVRSWVFDHFFLPPFEQGLQPSPPIGGMDFGFGITRNSGNPDAAWRVLESFVSGSGNQAAVDDLNNLPAFKGIAPQAANIPQTIRDQIARYTAVLDQARNQRLANPEVETALQNAMDGVVTGQLTVQQALQQIQIVQNRVGGQ